jgi:uncharacterized protein with NRDE domain
MCLILFGWRAHADCPLVVAANRDEFHGRPSAQAAFWDDHPQVLAGRDLECMGTWLGVTREGRFAAITNFRDMTDQRQGKRSRGLIASRFLEGAQSARDFVAAVTAEGDDYRGFNLLAADREEFWWVSNRDGRPRLLEPGIYGLSNHLLETPWPKVQRGKRELGRILGGAPNVEALLGLLADTAQAPDADLVHTGVGLERERMLSAARIVSPDYGTRCSSALIAEASSRVQFAERSYDPAGDAQETRRYEFRIIPGRTT